LNDDCAILGPPGAVLDEDRFSTTTGGTVATARAETRISRTPDEVWSAVSDPTGIASWFPGVTKCTCEGNVRHVWVDSGIEVDEEIISNDSNLRRFQYRLLPGPVPIEHHLATMDIIADGDGTLAIYSIDVQPEGFGPPMQQTAEAAVAGLKTHLDG